MITIAPLLGLLGTVSGLVNVFSNLGDSADHGAIAIGIAEALNTTIAGLAIAVPTVVAHSFFMKKIEKMGVRMEILLGGLLAARFREAAPDGASVRAGALATGAAPAEAGEIATPASPTPQVFTAIPDPGASTYPPPVPPRAEPALDPEPSPGQSHSAEAGLEFPVAGDPAPAPEGGFPRLLAGHRPEPAAPASPEKPSSASGAGPNS